MEPTTAPPESRPETTLVRRYFTEPDQSPLDQVEWEIRDAWPNGPEAYFHSGIEVPKSWSQTALDITSKLYLAKGDYHEESVRKLIERVAGRITAEGMTHGYFDQEFDVEQAHAEIVSRPDTEATAFLDELSYILVNQLAAFNSPVWFNIGRPDRKQQCSACFILGVDDNTTSIMEAARREAHIFKGGSGSGFNASRLRGSIEPLSTGGTASGPVSFMRLWDSGAGTFKSGGTTRRAAKLVRLDCDHPDILDFIDCKVREERRLRILAEAGINISMDMEGERNVAESTSFQNANNSVGVSDWFMELAEKNDELVRWPLKARKTGETISETSAYEMLNQIAKAAWECADPGLQYDTTINKWHTTPKIDGEDSPIRSSNPCSEYLSNDDTSCNLASVNVLKFVSEDGSFDIEGYQHTVDVMITAMDILVSFAEYPDDRIAKYTPALRQLGLGYSNLGAAIMAQGLPYDSDEARDFAAAVTALLTGRAYLKSTELAEKLEPFDYYAENRDWMLDVMEQHIIKLPSGGNPVNPFSPFGQIWDAASTDWRKSFERGAEHGYRNAQASVIPPAGTTSYLLDCDTTGIEPAFQLVTHKTLAGGGHMELVNKSVIRGLRRVVDSETADSLMETLIGDGKRAFLFELDDMNGPDRKVNCEVFYGANDISPEGHVKMVAAVQPFVSGGISKTINMPETSTWEDIREMYVLAWKLGTKCIAIYRDGSKARQVLHSKSQEKSSATEQMEQAEAKMAEIQQEHGAPIRRRLSRDAEMLRHKFVVGGFEGYILVGLYEDGTPGEIFLEDLGKDGSHLRGMTNAWAILFSHCLQYGVPLETLVKKFATMNFEPHGRTENPEIPTATSLLDYIMKYLASRFLGHEVHMELGILTSEVRARKATELDVQDLLASAVTTGPNGELSLDHELFSNSVADRLGASAKLEAPGMQVSADVTGPPCGECGGFMNRTGNCYTCPTCGNNTGCG